MQTKGQTILITGGGSGIGLEIAKLLATDNKVIIVGRTKQKLDEARQLLKNVITIQADVTSEQDTNRLMQEINNQYSDLSLLINNAGFAYTYTIGENAAAYQKSKAEFDTNYFAPIRLIEKLLPVLKLQPEAAIVNVTSAVALVPWVAIPTYSDSKAALHSFTQVLRHELAGSSVKVFELMPPLVNTEFAAELGGNEYGIPASQVASEFIKGIAEDRLEIPVGPAIELYNGFFANTKAAFNIMNRLGE